MADALVKIAAVSVALCWASCTSPRRPVAEGTGFVDAGPARAPFVCSGDRCVQRYPRFPDDGEWTCNDSGGAAVCFGGDPPAGVPFNTSDPTWICGQRRAGGHAREDGERVCVNLAPDFPDGTARGWRCHYAANASVSRICDRDPAAHAIGDACDARAPCLDGLRCLAGRCTPETPAPSCILDGDCDEGLCRWGSCWRGPT